MQCSSLTCEYEMLSRMRSGHRIMDWHNTGGEQHCSIGKPRNRRVTAGKSRDRIVSNFAPELKIRGLANPSCMQAPFCGRVGRFVCFDESMVLFVVFCFSLFFVLTSLSHRMLFFTLAKAEFLLFL